LLPLSPQLLLWIRFVASLLGLLCASAITWYLIDYFLYVYKSPSLFTPFSFRKVYYMAGPTIGWILIFIYSISNLFKIKSQPNNGG
jgi:TRAP-type C4-dicarboxylate transport system permease small subunit